MFHSALPHEITRNHEKENGLVVVKLDSLYTVLDEFYGINAKWVIGFSLVSINKALKELAK